MENKLMGNKLFLYITEFFAGVSVMAMFPDVRHSML